MTDAPQDDLTMAGHAKTLARAADALAKELGKPFPPWATPRETASTASSATAMWNVNLASLVAQLADIVTELAATHDRIDREGDRLPELVDIAQRGLDRVAYSFRPTGSPNDSRLAMQDLAMELRAALTPESVRTVSLRGPNQCEPGCGRPSLHGGDCDVAARVPWDGCESRAGDARGSDRRVADRCGETFNDSSAAEDRVWVCTETVGHVGYHYDAARLVGWGKKLPSMTPDYAAAILSRQTEPDPLDEDDHRPRHFADGEHLRRYACGHWHMATRDRCNEPDHGDGYTLAWWDEPLTFCDCP